MANWYTIQNEDGVYFIIQCLFIEHLSYIQLCGACRLRAGPSSDFGEFVFHVSQRNKMNIIH
jgi:hypothetical protein